MPILTLKTKDNVIEIPFLETPKLSSVFESVGLAFSSPCGGNGKCGKCAVDVSGAISSPTEKEMKLGKRLACQTVLLGDAEVKLPEDIFKNVWVETETGEISAENSGINYGAVVDLGTTTIALKLFSGTGEALAEVAEVNPQRTVSSDVIGRINAALNGKADLLQASVVGTLNKMLECACRAANINCCDVEKTVIVGNTAMLYLLCGTNVKSISSAPFTAEELFDEKITNPIEAYIPPCIAAFVGADLVCAVLASGMCDKHKTALLCDIGTNGEIALWKNGKLFVTSAAAGPAFEGAEISCGCQCVDGAIDKVWIDQGRVAVHTVNDNPAVGLCGSGLIDAVATFLELGYIDSSGKVFVNLKLPCKESDISITSEDIRSLQLAKSAIRSAMETLLEETETDVNDIEKLYLSGGFGNKINVKSAVTIGLIPAEFESKVTQIGNGALMGGGMILLKSNCREKTISIANKSVHIEIGGNENFNKRFINNIMF